MTYCPLNWHWRSLTRFLVLFGIVATLTPLWLTALAAPPAAEKPATTGRVSHPRERQPYAYLQESTPYYPHLGFPKLTTPQWVGEPGVEAVVVLAIDDMRGHERWEQYLRPILQRLKQIDGRAPVSIMTCQIDPQQPHLQTWLAEGLSLEVHTVDHPCPLLQGGDLDKARSTVQRCIDLMHQVPGNRPVGFRMPCCDSLNTLSPRFFDAILREPTAEGHVLSVDSSVFNILTADDPTSPRELVLNEQGGDRFRRYVPFQSFVNTIEDYPYPYIIQQRCWEFPCVVPSDWSAQHLQKPANPQTVADLKRALDLVVHKQGVYNLVFHPYEWIGKEQVVDIISHVVATHRNKVKFLTFREAHDRLTQHLADGHALRGPRGELNGVQLIDLNHDGYQDVVVCNPQAQFIKLWQPTEQTWKKFPFPIPTELSSRPEITANLRFGVQGPDQAPVVIAAVGDQAWGARWSEGEWQVIPGLSRLSAGADAETKESAQPVPQLDLSGTRLLDCDGDGSSELLLANPAQQAIYKWSEADQIWQRAPFTLPEGASFVTAEGRDAGLRMEDLDEDGALDVLFSDAERYHLALWRGEKSGWSEVVTSGTRGQKPAAEEFPAIASGGLDEGFWSHSRHFWWQNERTNTLPNLVDRRPWNDLLRSLTLTPKAPEAALATIKTRPGFTTELMASEPLTFDPVAFEWGADGKLWVAEMADYPRGLDGKGAPGGRVRYLEDTDGDGQYDKTTLFLDQIPFPTGVMPWKNGVLISTAPDIFFAADTDGDGRADVREVLFTGFAPGNQQHRVNGFVYGFDGWLYCANGDSGGVIKSMKTGQSVNISGRDLRIQPETGEIDPQTGQTQFGRNRDDWGNWFGCNNANPMYQFVLEDGYLRRNPHVPPAELRVHVSVAPGAAPVFPRSVTQARFNDLHTADRFTSACSAIVYRDNLFGPHFSQSMFISEPVHNLIHREVYTTNGVMFTSRRAEDEQASEFLASSDNWFRPTMIKTGPDGALWVADMYRHVIEHPEWIPLDWQQRLDLRAGHDRGRLYRVFPVGVTPRSIPRLSQLPTTELVAALDCPSGWQRDTVQRLLIERQDQSAVPLLISLGKAASHPQARLQAWWTLAGLQQLKLNDVLIAIRDPHPGVRRQGVKLLERFGKVCESITDDLWKLADDPDPFVQLQLAYSLGELQHSQVGALLARLGLRTREDRFIRSAWLSSIHRDNITDALSALLKEGAAITDPALIEQLLSLAADLEVKSAVGNLLLQLTAPEDKGYSARQFQTLQTLFATLARRQQNWREFLSENPDERMRTTNQLQALWDAAGRMAADDQQPEPDRIAAIGILGWEETPLETETKLLWPLIEPQAAGEIRRAALQRLLGIPNTTIPSEVLQRWKSFNPELRTLTLSELLSRNDGPAALWEAVQAGTVEPTAFDATRRQQLLERLELEPRVAAQKFFSATLESRKEVLRRYEPALTLQGDSPRGRQLFQKTCAQCHKLDGVGHVVGPDLAALTDKSPVALLTALLDPNRAVESKFLSFTAVTTAGKTISGLLSQETGNSLTFLGPEGKTETLLRRDLEELVGTSKSLMPEGIEKDHTPQDIADIIAFVRNQGPPPMRKSFPGNEPQLVRATDEGKLTLTAKSCQIYGKSLVFEPQYANLGYWMSNDDLAVWEIEITQAGKYELTLDYACPQENAGQSARLHVGVQELTFPVPATANWDTYRTHRAGQLQLTPGKYKVQLRGAEDLRGPLLDLKAIRFVRQ